MQPSRRSLLVCGASLFAAGCATRPSLVAASRTWPELEPVGVTAGREGLTVRVASRGCAAKADFVFHVDRAQRDVVIAFARRRIETCRSGQAGGVDLVFGYDELGLKRGERFTIANPPSR